MSFDYTRLVELTAVTTAGTTHAAYTNPSSTTSYIRQIGLHAPGWGLTGFSAATISIFLVGDTGGAVGTPHNPTNQYFCMAMTTNQTYIIDFGVPGYVMKDTNETVAITHLSQTTLTYYIMGGIEV